MSRLSCLWHVRCTNPLSMVEAIRDQWLIIAGVAVIVAIVVWLVARR